MPRAGYIRRCEAGYSAAAPSENVVLWTPADGFVVGEKYGVAFCHEHSGNGVGSAGASQMPLLGFDRLAPQRRLIASADNGGGSDWGASISRLDDNLTYLVS